ncbi:unnamed protein product, partial [Musa acuminata subsp. burmannicoides]
ILPWSDGRETLEGGGARVETACHDSGVVCRIEHTLQSGLERQHPRRRRQPISLRRHLHRPSRLLHRKMLCCSTTGIAFTLLGWCINKCYEESSRRN